MAKLTLSVDEGVVERAKRYAAECGTSISRLVETYLDLLARPPVARDEDIPPIVKRLYGCLKGARYSREEYRRYLERKYR